MTALQMGLFDPEPALAPPLVAEPDGVDWDALDGLALLYTATEKGSNSGIRFAMSRDHAMVWCESPVSAGQLHGTRWAYFWTSARNFITCHWGTGTARIITKGLEDNGQWDERIAAAGLTKISLPEFPAVFGPLGVEVVT